MPVSLPRRRLRGHNVAPDRRSGHVFVGLRHHSLAVRAGKSPDRTGVDRTRSLRRGSVHHSARIRRGRFSCSGIRLHSIVLLSRGRLLSRIGNLPLFHKVYCRGRPAHECTDLENGDSGQSCRDHRPDTGRHGRACCLFRATMRRPIHRAQWPILRVPAHAS